MPDTLSQEEATFQAALEIVAVDQRAAYLDEACRGQPELRRRIEALLRRYAESSGPLDRPAVGLAATTDESRAECPGAVIGPYKLLEEIGEGGFGVVFMAEQSQPVRRKVALKVLKPGMDTRQVVARFEAERQALALMDHPNIAHVFDGGETVSGRPYFVMELVRGVPVTEFCDRNSLPIRQRLELFVTVCQAVQHAHQKGIIHRDLKPTNVLIASHDGTPVVKVIDFGIAKSISGTLTDKTLFTGFAQMIGTPAYMSPEQAGQSSLDVDTRSDIYSLGVLLYELLTSTTPFDAQTLKKLGYDEMRRMIRDDEPPRPSERISTLENSILSTVAGQHGVEPRKLSQQLRGELDWIVMKCLEKDRNRRYETAVGLAHDIERYLHDEPVQACPPSAGYRLRKFVRRNRGPVLAVSLVVLALVAGIVGTTWGMVCADWAREAEAERAEGESRAKVEAQEAAAAERKAKDAEIAQRLRAEDYAKLAMAVLDEIFMKEARHRLTLSMQDAAKGLGKNPERDKLEREFLEKGLRFYEKLAQANPTDWAARRERARAYANVGLLQLDVKNYAESEKAYRQAIHLMEELASERPGDFDNAFDLAHTYHWLYMPYWNTGRLQQAEEVTRHALALFESLATDFPHKRRQAQQYGVYCLQNLAVVLQKAGRFQEVEKASRAAMTFWEHRVAESPTVADDCLHLSWNYARLAENLLRQGKAAEAAKFTEKIAELAAANRKLPELRDVLARIHRTLALVLKETGQVDEAEKEFRQAFAIWQKLAAEFPREAPYQSHVAHLDWSFAGMLKDAAKPKEAEEAYRRALGIFEKLAADYPAAAFYRQEHAFTYWLMAGMLKDTGQVQEAEKAYRQALPILEKLVADFPNNAEYRARLSSNLGALAENLLQQGQHAEAAKVAEKMAGAVPKDANGHQNAALVLVRCMARADKDVKLSEMDRKAVAQAYADRAKELIQEAAKRGLDTPGARELQEALRLPRGDPQAHYKLSVALFKQGNFADAEAECREALRLRPDYVEAHYYLGRALTDQDKLAEAEAEFREALRLRPDFRQGYVLMGLVLARQGKPAAAVRFYTESFAADPALADDLRFANRYNAACVAVLAGCGQGKDAIGLDDAERARLRRQALDWLRADLTAWGQLLEKQPDNARPRVQQQLRHWQQDTDFAGVRGDALAKLPDAERQAWQQLWADVEQTLRKADPKDTKDTKKKSPK